MAVLTTRFATIVSKAQYDYVYSRNATAFPFREVVPIPIYGRVRVTQSLDNLSDCATFNL